MVTKSNTKAELLSHIATLDAELATQALYIQTVHAELSMARSYVPKNGSARPPRAPWRRPEWMEAARAMAIASGRPVLVSA